jgi:hypothetical protein
VNLKVDRLYIVEITTCKNRRVDHVVRMKAAGRIQRGIKIPVLGQRGRRRGITCIWGKEIEEDELHICCGAKR